MPEIDGNGRDASEVQAPALHRIDQRSKRKSAILCTAGIDPYDAMTLPLPD